MRTTCTRGHAPPLYKSSGTRSRSPVDGRAVNYTRVCVCVCVCACRAKNIAYIITSTVAIYRGGRRCIAAPVNGGPRCATRAVTVTLDNITPLQGVFRAHRAVCAHP
ncbi:Uncharacterized protein FWK35_00005873 [Aphis craccivora]|uniref:Uncharacterized protein n=1 Tax=Aphis craccivora TaxID=307492 RepID=A0A6G0ZJW4_APHCR|nr:Uncharacterized protein FWK35_00005873 [Aphis craccivora]